MKWIIINLSVLITESLSVITWRKMMLKTFFSYWFVQTESFRCQTEVLFLRDSHNNKRKSENWPQLCPDFKASNWSETRFTAEKTGLLQEWTCSLCVHLQKHVSYTNLISTLFSSFTKMTKLSLIHLSMMVDTKWIWCLETIFTNYTQTTCSKILTSKLI